VVLASSAVGATSLALSLAAQAPGTFAAQPGTRGLDARTGPRHAEPRRQLTRKARGTQPRRRVDVVSGQSVTAIGDSILVASTPAIDQALPGISINAQVGRQFSTGLGVLAWLKQQGQMRHIVVFALGTNGTVTPAEISELYALIGPHRRLVLVNTFAARPWEPEVNAILAATAASHAGTVLADWHDTIASRTYLLWSDGIHPQPAGGVVYARMLKAAVQRAANLPG
jgi:hypothetical protein